jgi:acetyl esterase
MLLSGKIPVSMLAVCLFAFGALHADGPAKPIDKGQRVFTAGHSLHHVGGAFMPTLQNVAELAGIKGHVVAGYWPVGNYQQYWKDPDEKHKLKQVLRDGKVDVLTLVGIVRNGADPGIEEFTKFALKHNPDIRITLQASWLQYDDPKLRVSEIVDWDAATGEKLRKNHAEYFKTTADQVRAVNKQLGKDVLFLVPVGEATIALREKIMAGRVPGLKKQADLFSDDLGHAREPLKVLVAYCHFAVIYRRSPVGLPMPTLLKNGKNPAWDENLNRLLQELAWEAVIKEPLSGVTAANGAKPPLAPPKKGGPVRLTEIPVKYEKISYRQTPQVDLKMHVYYPPDWQKTDQRPAIVFLFSGGWDVGSYVQFIHHAKYFASRGMVACCADYRTRLAHKTMPDQCVVDAKAAVRWLRLNAKELGIDPGKIVAAGGSAGGHLAAATAVVPGFDAKEDDRALSPIPNALVMFNPPLNFPGAKILDGEGNNIADKIAPTRFLNEKAPPAILFYGSKDGMKAQGAEYVARCKELGVRTEMYLAEDEPHGFYNRSPWVEVTVNKADTFLQSLGFLKGPSQVKVPADAKPLQAVAAGNPPTKDSQVDAANEEKEKNNKLLKDSAAKGDAATVLAMIKKGADVQWRDPKDNGKTALTRSILNGRFDVVKVLLESGADINYPDGSNRYPIYFSVFGPHAEMLKFLLSKGGDRDLNRPPFILVSLCDHAQGPAELIPILIKAGANPNLQHEQLRTTPLIEAIKQDGINAKRRPELCLAYVRALIENGADVNLKDKKGMSPLQWATLRGNNEIIAILKKAGAKE